MDAFRNFDIEGKASINLIELTTGLLSMGL